MFGFAEFIPFLCGVTIGLFAKKIGSVRLRQATWIGLSLVCGSIANLLSGEARALLLLDALVVAGCARAVATANISARCSGFLLHVLTK